MKAHRLRAPSTDGALLATPPLDEAGSQVDANVRRLATWDHDFQGRRSSWLRDLVRLEVADEARRFLLTNGVEPPETAASGPLVVTGHQPELFHPGVWVKNFAASAIAARQGGVGLNLIVDDDIPKSSSIRVPHAEGGRISAHRLEFDRWEGEAPYEDLPVHDEAVFASFGARVVERLGGLVADPLIEDLWPRVAARREGGLPLGLRLALARRDVEASWGVSNLEIPISRLCQTEGFAWFACHLLAHLPRYQEVYNDALREYRAVYGIRSKNHPVSALQQQGEWLEAPFWVWRAARPRRRPLLVRQGRTKMDLRIAGEDEPFLQLPLSADREACCAVERFRELPEGQIRLRTRALTTTMFSRCLLGDLFIHGIGGAKYDELGDAITSRFLGFEPPGFLTLSMTAWLGLAEHSTSPAALAAIDRTIRSLIYNPDRHLSEPWNEDQRSLVQLKRAVIEREAVAHPQRIARFREIREINEALQPAVAGRLASLRDDRRRVVQDLEANRVAHSREFSFVLYPRERMRALMGGVEQAIREGSSDAVELALGS
ncbi:MAG: hypothetical protein P4L85_15635 [Paludisphaera borealis]|uniref:hypothetical protein n=1 Tax=Paludisphaera borealis TaxID=1387353 RepID=UPI00284FE34D|nr:hypothetical protein [Paludisphaera borealis]MDR3620783.1 hypothetical protein [Paludisphaera borealis]